MLGSGGQLCLCAYLLTICAYLLASWKSFDYDVISRYTLSSYATFSYVHMAWTGVYILLFYAYSYKAIAQSEIPYRTYTSVCYALFCYDYIIIYSGVFLSIHQYSTGLFHWYGCPLHCWPSCSMHLDSCQQKWCDISKLDKMWKQLMRHNQENFLHHCHFLRETIGFPVEITGIVEIW